MSEREIICERRGAAGLVTLDRPGALNALTQTMVRALGRALDDWESDGSIERIVIAGAGGRAFCAGGDIRLLHDQGRAGDHESQLAFWREEYLLNDRIARYPKPYVALMDGFVMGGGAGVSIHGSHRVTGERLSFAMPEVSIGFFPDIGASFFLPRLPGQSGAWLALSGERIGAGDACRLGLATAFVPSARFPALAEALTISGDTDAIIAGHSVPAPVAPLADDQGIIDSCFGADDPRDVVAALDKAASAGSAFAAGAAATIRAKSPTSVAIGLRQMRLGATLSVQAALRMEFRIVSRICRMHDLYEGVRAAIIDKDRKPHWLPTRFEDLDPAVIDGCFESLGAADLVFPQESVSQESAGKGL